MPHWGTHLSLFMKLSVSPSALSPPSSLKGAPCVHFLSSRSCFKWSILSFALCSWDSHQWPYWIWMVTWKAQFILPGILILCGFGIAPAARLSPEPFTDFWTRPPPVWARLWSGPPASSTAPQLRAEKHYCHHKPPRPSSTFHITRWHSRLPTS